MPTDGHELTLSVQQSFPEAGSVSSPVGGSWPAGTFSFKVAAWHFDTESSQDQAGLIRTNVPAWEGIVVAGSDKVVVNWDSANTIPDHYNVYYIENATYNNGTGGTVFKSRKIAEVQGDVLTATINKPFLQQGSSTNFTSTTTGANSNTILIDASASFQTNGMKAGDSVSNVTGAFTSTIISVDSEIQITTDDNGQYTMGDTYRITSTTSLEDTGATFVTNGVLAGHYVILNAGAVVPSAYARITTVVSETVLITAALTSSASYELADPYDVVLKVDEFALDPTEFVANPIMDLLPVGIRQTVVRGFNGRLVNKSYALKSPLDNIAITFWPISISLADSKTIAKWIFWGVRIRITESASASALITPMDGRISEMSFMPTKFKNSRFGLQIDVELELGTIT